MLTLCCLLVCPASAQEDNGKEKSGQKNKNEDGTIHLRIEKSENGQKKVYERTYRADELNKHIFPDGFMFQDGDSMDTFDFFGNNLFDSIKVLDPSGKILFDSLERSLSENRYSFKYNLDSLQKNSGNIFYHFDHSMMPDLDSLLRKSMDASNFIFENMAPSFQFQFDTIFNNRFDFNWDDTMFPFNGNNRNLLLDKDEYEIEEIEKDGKKMIRIRPKKSSGNNDELFFRKKQENLPDNMQPSGDGLNLIANGNTGIVTLRFQVPADGLTVIKVNNAKGKRVYKEKVKNKAGILKTTINLSKEGPGEYTVSVDHLGKNISKRVTIQ